MEGASGAGREGAPCSSGSGSRASRWRGSRRRPPEAAAAVAARGSAAGIRGALVFVVEIFPPPPHRFVLCQRAPSRSHPNPPPSPACLDRHALRLRCHAAVRYSSPEIPCSGPRVGAAQRCGVHHLPAQWHLPFVTPVSISKTQQRPGVGARYRGLLARSQPRLNRGQESGRKS